MLDFTKKCLTLCTILFLRNTHLQRISSIISKLTYAYETLRFSCDSDPDDVVIGRRTPRTGIPLSEIPQASPWRKSARA